jgi:hypothetical protein
VAAAATLTHKIPPDSDFGIRRNYSRDQQVPNGRGLTRL